MTITRICILLIMVVSASVAEVNLIGVGSWNYKHQIIQSTSLLVGIIAGYFIAQMEEK